MRADTFILLALAGIGVYVWQANQPPPGVAVDRSSIRVIDGDTIDIGEQRYRLVGYDTPETGFAKCAEEQRRGTQATERLKEMISAASVISMSTVGHRDRYERRLGTLTLDGEDVGETLISEGLARKYDGGARQGWC